MPNYMTLATCNLNQWALDWEGNVERIISSIQEAKVRQATLRVGPELEITGYGCYDHFLESDTFLHSWEMLSRILRDVSCREILLDIGMPVMVRTKTLLELVGTHRPTRLTQDPASQRSLQLPYHLLQRRHTSYSSEVVLGRKRQLSVRKGMTA